MIPLMLIPKDTVFYDMFDNLAKTVHKGAVQIAAMLDNFKHVEDQAQMIKDTEHAADHITHDIIERTNKTFLTPLEREDIHELACRLDDILDLIDGATRRIVLYKIKEPTSDARALAQVLIKATQLIVEALGMLRTSKDRAAMLKFCIDIHTCENDGDRIEQHALASLFEGNMGPVEIIKWKDIYEDLETATDKCEDVANVLEAIVLKMS